MEQQVSTLFVVKEDEEYCFLFDRENPNGLYDVLFEHAQRPEMGLTQREVFEVIEGLVPDRLRTV